jgi:hypothetical protein
VKISLLMLVERDAEGRLTGVVFQEGQHTPGCFSGAPELLKIMEGVLPREPALLGSAGGSGPGSAPESAGG